jgi:hypothetical protein
MSAASSEVWWLDTQLRQLVRRRCCRKGPLVTRNWTLQPKV